MSLKVCFDFQKGKCTRDICRFAHVEGQPFGSGGGKEGGNLTTRSQVKETAETGTVEELVELLNAQRPNWVLQFLVEKTKIGDLIGTKGVNIKEFQERGESKIDVHRDLDVTPNSPNRMVSLQGTVEKVTKTAFLIAAFLGVTDTKGKQVPTVLGAYEKQTPEEMDLEQEPMVAEGETQEDLALPSEFSIRLLAQTQIMNWIIGKKGGQIRKVQEENNVKLAVDTDSGMVTITGSYKDMKNGLLASVARIFSGQFLDNLFPVSGALPNDGASLSTIGSRELRSISRLSLDEQAERLDQLGKEELRILLPDKSVGAMIGRKGVVVNAIQKNSGCQIDVTKGQVGARGRPIAIRGRLQQIVLACSEIIEAVAENGEGYLKFEIMLPEDILSGIIPWMLGQRGNIIQTMQKEYNCRLDITREGRPCTVLATPHGAWDETTKQQLLGVMKAIICRLVIGIKLESPKVEMMRERERRDMMVPRREPYPARSFDRRERPEYYPREPERRPIEYRGRSPVRAPIDWSRAARLDDVRTMRSPPRPYRIPERQPYRAMPEPRLDRRSDFDSRLTRAPSPRGPPRGEYERFRAAARAPEQQPPSWNRPAPMEHSRREREPYPQPVYDDVRQIPRGSGYTEPPRREMPPRYSDRGAKPPVSSQWPSTSEIGYGSEAGAPRREAPRRPDYDIRDRRPEPRAPPAALALPQNYDSRGTPNDRVGGFANERSGGFANERAGGFANERASRFPSDRGGGFPSERGGGFPSERGGGFPSERSGGYPGDRAGGFTGDKGGYPSNREGFQRNDRGVSRGGYQRNESLAYGGKPEVRRSAPYDTSGGRPALQARRQQPPAQGASRGSSYGPSGGSSGSYGAYRPRPQRQAMY